ncbi:hypothetical protein JCM14076_05890 [Methylosoma difficile]
MSTTKRTTFYEAGSALLFIGLFSQQADLQQAGDAALKQLASYGYQIPNASEPVRVFAAATQARFGTHHAGAWRPGGIYLRDQPEGGLAMAVYLRHELFHEASYRTCNGRWPEWAEEAAAMHFSGELATDDATDWPSGIALERFKEKIQQQQPLSLQDRQLLKHLASNAVWPNQACKLPVGLEDWLGNLK